MLLIMKLSYNISIQKVKGRTKNDIKYQQRQIVICFLFGYDMFQYKFDCEYFYSI